nr:hypothetical protein [Commensalibacter sp. M0268]
MKLHANRLVIAVIPVDILRCDDGHAACVDGDGTVAWCSPGDCSIPVFHIGIFVDNLRPIESKPAVFIIDGDRVCSVHDRVNGRLAIGRGLAPAHRCITSRSKRKPVRSHIGIRPYILPVPGNGRLASTGSVSRIQADIPARIEYHVVPADTAGRGFDILHRIHTHFLSSLYGRSGIRDRRRRHVTLIR